MTDHNASESSPEADELPTEGGDTSGKRPEPVVNNQLISGLATLAVGALIAYLARHGILLPDGADDYLVSLVSAGGTALVGLLLGWVAARRARAQVTPIEDPKDKDGTPLVPVGSESATELVKEYWEEHPGDPINEQN